MQAAVISLLFLTILEDDWTSKDERKHDGTVDKSSSTTGLFMDAYQ